MNDTPVNQRLKLLIFIIIPATAFSLQPAATALKFYRMITQYDAITMLKTAVPAIASKNYPSSMSLEIYATVIYFTDYTKQALEQHHFEEAKKCFQLAEKLYINGDSIVRPLMGDSFIYSISSLMSPGSKNLFVIKAILPPALLALFQKHLSAAH